MYIYQIEMVKRMMLISNQMMKMMMMRLGRWIGDLPRTLCGIHTKGTLDILPIIRVVKAWVIYSSFTPDELPCLESYFTFQ